MTIQVTGNPIDVTVTKAVSDVTANSSVAKVELDELPKNDVVVEDAGNAVITSVDRIQVDSSPVSVDVLVEDGSQLVAVPSSEVATVVVAGIQGPEGKAGISEEETMYAKRVDFIDELNLYRGEAVPGTIDSDPLWRIRKITLYADDDVREVWADGSDAFNQVWDDRLTLTYS